MKWSWKRELYPVILLALLTVFTLYTYSRLPDPMPSHFDSEGNVNGWMGKIGFIWMMAGLTFGMYFLITFIPFIDPLWKKIEPKYRLILIIRDFIVGFLAFVFALNIVAAIEGRLRFELLGGGLGLLLILIGNYMPKLPQNWFVGIRTPWTLSSEVIWRKTHLLGGWLFALSGLVFMLCAILKVSIVVPMVSLIAVALFSGVIYPLYLFKKLPQEERAVKNGSSCGSAE
jgi:uncharacterized membrane protein